MMAGAAVADPAPRLRPLQADGAPPFAARGRDAYARWRDAKLRNYPRTLEDIVVEVDDPRRLTRAEHAAIRACLARANMAVYASRVREPDRAIARLLAAQFGLGAADANWLADEDAISSIEVREHGPKRDHIPYTNLPLSWHTDGYYHPPGRAIRAMILHCVRQAASGGENLLLDHELAYLALRDLDPAHVRCLMRPDAMTIPARWESGAIARAAQSGPVFSVGARDGRLHMRYTSRTRSIAWRDDAQTREAVALLSRLLAGELEQTAARILRVRLEPGMGLICANVLHARSRFSDDPDHPRLLYRARYHDALAFD